MTVGGRTVDFTVSEDGDPIWFWRRLEHASIEVNTGVILGIPGGEFRLGPTVYIQAAAITCPGELTINLGRDRDQDEELLIADEFEAMTKAPTVRGTRLRIRGHRVPWPWSVYRDQESAPASATPEIMQAYNHMARILRPLRAKGHREMGRIDDLVERIATGGTTEARDVLGFLVERKLITKSGKMYLLQEDVVSEYGINYDDLRRRIPRQSVIDLLTDFVQRKR